MRPTPPSCYIARTFVLLFLAGLTSVALGFAPHVPSALAQQAAPNSELPEEEDVDDSDDESEPATEGTESPATEDSATAPAEAAEDIESLRAEYFKLRDRLFQSRARASAVASALYSTRLAVQLDYKSARYYTVTRAIIRLDGASIYDDTSAAIASDDANRFEGYIAPGRHQLSIRIEATGKDDDRFTSIIDNSFVVQATKDKDLQVRVSAQDGGDIAYSWSKNERGSYNLQMKVNVKSVKRAKQTSQARQTGAPREAATAKGKGGSDERVPKRPG